MNIQEEDNALLVGHSSDTEGGGDNDALLDEILNDASELSALLENKQQPLDTEEESDGINYEATYTQTNAPSPPSEPLPIMPDSAIPPLEQVALQILVPQEAWNEMSPKLKEVGYNTESPAMLFQDMLKKHALKRVEEKPPVYDIFPKKETKREKTNPYLKYGLIILGAILLIGILWVIFSKKGAAKAVINTVKETAIKTVDTVEAVVNTVKETAIEIKHKIPV